MLYAAPASTGRINTGRVINGLLSTKRHTEGRDTVFGVYDELTLNIVGTCPGKIATYRATAGQAPGVVLEGTLILTEQQPPDRERAVQVPAFNPDKLPKLPKRSR